MDESVSIRYGLGYDSVDHDYKIVTLTQYFEKSNSFVEVYSVKNGIWKNLENRPYDDTFCLANVGVFINGYIHCLVFNESQNEFKILSFDLAQEKFHEALLPIAVTKDITYGDFNDIGLLGGCLCVICSCYGGESCVWIMNEYGNNESWTQFTFIDPEENPVCLSVLDHEQVLVERILGYYTGKLVKYNLKNGTYKDIVVDGVDSDNICVGGAFVEGLVSPYCSLKTS